MHLFLDSLLSLSFFSMPSISISAPKIYFSVSPNLNLYPLHHLSLNSPIIIVIYFFYLCFLSPFSMLFIPFLCPCFHFCTSYLQPETPTFLCIRYILFLLAILLLLYFGTFYISFCGPQIVSVSKLPFLCLLTPVFIINLTYIHILFLLPPLLNFCTTSLF